MGIDGTKKSPVATVITVLLLILLAAAWLVVWPNSSGRQAPGTATAGDSAQRYEAGNRPVAPVISEKEQSKSAAASSPEPVPTQPVPAPDKRRIVLRFQYEGGGAVAHWKFRYAIFDLAGCIEQLDIPGDQGGKPAERCTLDGVSSLEGAFELYGEAPSTAAILLCPVNPGLVFSSPGDTGHSLAPHECAYRVQGADREITVVLRASNRVAFTIVYADGQPFEGEAGISSGGTGVKSSMRRQELAAGQDLAVDLPNSVAEVQVGVQHNRPGFNAFPQWKFKAPDIPPARS